MRILAIRGHNLASLARSFEVDFATGPLARAGLFAITGPVGAGKSTLLDALCLALFDRTPRLSGRGGPLVGDDREAPADWLRSSDPRTLLRRDAAEAHAEVDFTGRDANRYRARWTVRRARRRPDGRVQDQEMWLHDLDRDVRVAGGRKTEVLAAIEQRLGLDFGQFCRSVLLAQGDFAAFLRASADERARLLENLTGASIYRHLSRAAHEARRRREDELAALQAQAEAHVLLGDSERASLVQDVQRLMQELRMCQLGIDLAQGYVSWYRTAADLRQAESEATVQLREACKAVDAAAERRESLQRQVDALPIVPRLELVLARQKELAAATKALADARSNAVAAAARLAAAERSLRVELEASGSAGSADVPHVVRELARWEVPLQQWLAARTALEAGAAHLPQLEAEAAAAAAAVAKVERALAQANAVLRAAEEQRLAAARVLASEELSGLGEARRRLGDASARHHRQRTGFVAWQHGWRERQDADAELAHAVENAAAAAAGFEELVARRTAAEQELVQARQLLDAVRTRADLGPLRHSLVDGAPCPLCGATEHPGVEAPPGELAAATAAVEAAEHAFDGARDDVSRREVQRVEAERARSRAVDKLAAAAANEARARSAWTATVAAPVAAFDVTGAAAWLEGEAARLAADGEQLEALAAAVEAARATHEVALSAERRAADEMRRYADHLHAARDAVGTARLGVERAAAEQARRRTSVQELEALLAPAFAGLDGWRERLGAGPSGLARLRAASVLDAQCAAAAAARDEAQGTVRDCAATAERVESELRAADDAFAGALRAAAVGEADVREAARAGAGDLAARQAELRELEVAVVQRRAALQACAELRRRHEANERPAILEEDATAAHRDALLARDRVQHHLAAAQTALAADDLMRRQRDEIAPRVAVREQDLAVWRALDDLIGSSGGDAFAVFAQSLTLDMLLAEANRRLAEIARRYRLQKNPGTEMDFVVVDLDLGGTRRSLHSLSGGETFLVSLSLALALASLAAPRSRVETLFLDEGFGTLDAQHLETALGALDALQASGCQVGVISHVDGIAERIGAVVEVRPEGGGQSRVLARVR